MKWLIRDLIKFILSYKIPLFFRAKLQLKTKNRIIVVVILLFVKFSCKIVLLLSNGAQTLPVAKVLWWLVHLPSPPVRT